MAAEHTRSLKMLWRRVTLLFQWVWYLLTVSCASLLLAWIILMMADRLLNPVRSDPNCQEVVVPVQHDAAILGRCPRGLYVGEIDDKHDVVICRCGSSLSLTLKRERMQDDQLPATPAVSITPDQDI